MDRLIPSTQMKAKQKYVYQAFRPGRSVELLPIGIRCWKTRNISLPGLKDVYVECIVGKI